MFRLITHPPPPQRNKHVCWWHNVRNSYRFTALCVFFGSSVFTLHRKILRFNESVEVTLFSKYYGKKEKMLVTSFFAYFFSQNAFLLQKGTSTQVESAYTMYLPFAKALSLNKSKFRFLLNSLHRRVLFCRFRPLVHYKIQNIVGEGENAHYLLHFPFLP